MDKRINAKNELKFFRVPLLILTAFLVCNCIPDMIFTFVDSEVFYNIMVLMWGLGYLIDPCVYIFINKRTRKTAQDILGSLICVHWKHNNKKDSLRLSRRIRSKVTTKIYDKALCTESVL